MLNEMLDDFTSAITSNLSTFSTGAMGLVGVLALIDTGWMLWDMPGKILCPL